MKKMSEHLAEIKMVDYDMISMRPPLPEKLQLELNETCNHRCVFCPFHSPYMTRKQDYAVMDTQYAKDIISNAADKGIGMKELGLFASGEPFLFKDLSEIVYHAKQLGFPYVYITTNGVLATPCNAKKIIDAGIDSIRFSVNGGRKHYAEIHGGAENDYTKVIENIRWISDYRKVVEKSFNLSVSFVKTRVTREEEPYIRDDLQNYVDEIITFDVEHTELISPECFKKYSLNTAPKKIESGNRKICASIFNTMYIDSHKNLNLCCASYWSKIRMATVNSADEIESAWYSDAFCDFRKRMIFGELEGTVCDECSHRTITLG